MSDTKFKPGESGNPLGRPKGSKDKRTQHRELFHSRARELSNKAVELALAGDTACLKMCLDRIVPSYRPKEAGIELGDIRITRSSPTCAEVTFVSTSSHFRTS